MESIKRDELETRVEPGMWSRWFGTEQQLRDAGLLPAAVVTPRGEAVAEWTADGTDFALWRYPRRAARLPAGANERDQWLLQAAPIAIRGLGLAGSAAIAAALEVRAEAQSAINTASGIGAKAAAAGADTGFQRLMNAIVPRLV